MEGKSTLYKRETLGNYAQEGSLVSGLKKYELGATKEGYGKGLDARILFDEKYCIPIFCKNKNEYVNRNNNASYTFTKHY